MSTIERTFNFNNALTPYPWIVGDVKVFYYDDGKPACFALTESAKATRSSLPVEFFNHELKEIDINDGDALAKFMSEYGILSGYPISREVEQSPRALDVCIYADYGLFDRPPHFPGRRADSRYQDAHRNDPQTWFCDQVGVAQPDQIYYEPTDQKGRKGTVHIPSARELDLDTNTIIQYEAVRDTFRFFRLCTNVYAALLEYNTTEEIAKVIAREESQISFIVDECDARINGFLHNYSPEVGLVIDGVSNMGNLHAPDKQTEEDYLIATLRAFARPPRTDPRFDFKPGSLAQAIALQLRQFTLSGDHWTKCKECGTVFAERRTKNSTQRSRSSAEFCCEKCRSRTAQRNHRNSPGYKAKQAAKKKAQADKEPK